MRTKTLLALCFCLTAASALADPKQPPAAAPAEGRFTRLAGQGKELWATFETTQGRIVARLFSKDAPKTVANFAGLAMGEKAFTDPATGEPARKHFYDGLVFHRVIPDFMIQGGDPLGVGHGGPGFTFDDEFQSGRGFDKPGLLAMANRGPNTNGSQFFITTSTPRHLNGHHTIFGEVVEGYDVAERISQVPTRGPNMPVTPVTITKLTITDKAPAPAKAPAAPAKKEKP
jgi:peptidyl-prolyl cis-trans isomerase A (cyclophilin A)